MKKQTKIIVGVFAVLVVAFSAALLYIPKTYYPMGGEVNVVAKNQSIWGYSIIIEENVATGKNEQFALKCSIEQYNSVEIGDTINCERYQSILTHRGTVHKIK